MYYVDDMNSLDASNKLFEWFADKDTLSIDRDFSRILPESTDKEEDRAVLLCALKDLQKIDFIQESNEYWVLKKPFSSFTQTVELPAQLCLSISQLVNGFCDILGNDSDNCESSNLQTKDIMNVVTICGYLMQENTPREGEESPES